MTTCWNVLVIYLVGHWILDWPPASCQRPRGGGQVLVPGRGTEQDGHRGLSRGEVCYKMWIVLLILLLVRQPDNPPPLPSTHTHTNTHTCTQGKINPETQELTSMSNIRRMLFYPLHGHMLQICKFNKMCSTVHCVLSTCIYRSNVNTEL